MNPFYHFIYSHYRSRRFRSIISNTERTISTRGCKTKILTNHKDKALTRKKKRFTRKKYKPKRHKT